MTLGIAERVIRDVREFYDTDSVILFELPKEMVLLGKKTRFFSVGIYTPTSSVTDYVSFPCNSEGDPLEWESLTKVRGNSTNMEKEVEKIERMFVKQTGYKLPWFNGG